MLFQGLNQNVKENLFARAQNKKISLPEGHDERVQQAANFLKKELHIECFLGNKKESELTWQKTMDVMQKVALQKGKSLNSPAAKMWAADPTFEGGAKLFLGEVDAVVSGCTCSTAHVIRAALNTVGLKPQTKIMTSAFLLALQQQTAGGESLISFSDCAVIPQPTTDQLVDIAFLSQQAYESWTQRKPKIAFLSFSTAGSAQHAEVEKVAQASRFFQKNYPAILAEGEVQFDAACDPFIAMRKSPTGQVQGKANVFVFPDLNSGNIAYKIAQRLGGAQAWGPVLLGAIKPFSDLSRGASAQDIAHAAALTLALSSHADAQC